MQKLSPFEVSEICDELGEPYPKSIEHVQYFLDKVHLIHHKFR